MLSAVENTRGVIAPSLTYIKSPDGMRPSLEFHTSDGATWTGSTRLGLEKGDRNDYQFQVNSVATPKLDDHLVDTILREWKERCGASVELKFGIN
jgi:hypothetical protein